jgi:hypothetical protein
MYNKGLKLMFKKAHTPANLVLPNNSNIICLIVNVFYKITEYRFFGRRNRFSHICADLIKISPFHFVKNCLFINPLEKRQWGGGRIPKRENKFKFNY